ncbi:anti-sigma factor domain-containing protein [Clostridium polynesiense]|uniref:anti-sigma factor domain-containing protein n=1 Tax=Clostridium polynesiense TaxID=1325933 RepID=UPI00058FE47B
MYYKAIVMEIRKPYALVMKNDGSIIRIKYKEGLKIGETILFLEEDIYKEYKKTVSLFNYRKLLKNTAIAALLLIVFIIPILPSRIAAQAYATLSLDNNSSVKMNLDREKKIISINGKNPQGEIIELNQLKGKNFDEASEVLKNLLKSQGNKSMIIGFAFHNDVNDTEYEKYIKKILVNNFKDSEIVYIKGNDKDISESELKGLSLGLYQAEKTLSKDDLEDEIENKDIDELIMMLKKYSSVTYWNSEMVDEIMDELNDKIEDKEEENQDIEDDEKEVSNKIEEDDDEGSSAHEEDSSVEDDNSSEQDDDASSETQDSETDDSESDLNSDTEDEN